MPPLSELLKQRSERGTTIGAEEIIDRVNADLTGVPVISASDRTRRSWAALGRRSRLTLAFGGALALLVAVIGIPILLLRDGPQPEKPPMATDPAVTPAPVTVPNPGDEPIVSIVTPPDTVVAPPVSTTPPIRDVVAPVPVFEWAKVTDSSGAFAAGDGYMFLEAVTVGGPGLVAVGGECPGSRDCIAGTPVDWTAAVWVSPDGFAWERVPHDEDIFGGPGSQVMLDVTPGGPGLVAVGFVDPSNFLRGRWHGLRNVGPLEDLDGAIWVSVDGIAWERVPDPTVAFSGEGDQIIHAVISTGSGLMAVGAAGGDAAVWVSPDGLAWSLLPQDTDVFGGNSNQWIHDVAVGGVGFVAVGVDWDDPESGGVPRSAVWTSVDGLAWTRATHDSAVFGGDEGDDGAGMDLMWTVTSTGNGVVASGWTYDYGEQAVWASPDGLTWQKAPDTYGLIAGTRSGPTKALVFHQGEVIGVGWDSGSTSISVDVPPHFEPNFTFDYVYPWTSMNDAVVFDGRVVAVGYDRFNGGVWHGGFGG